MGYVGCKALRHVHEDDAKDIGSSGAQTKFPAFVDTGSALVDKENVGGWSSK